jgi:hypothetical protein
MAQTPPYEAITCPSDRWAGWVGFAAAFALTARCDEARAAM